MKFYILVIMLGSNVLLASPIKTESVSDYDGGNKNRMYKSFVSFYELFSNTRQFHEKTIQVHGYLVYEDGVLALYPNKTSLDMYVGEDSLELQTSESRPSVSSALMSSGLHEKLKISPQFVSVIGVFQFNSPTIGPNRLGVVYVKSIEQHYLKRNFILKPPRKNE